MNDFQLVKNKIDNDMLDMSLYEKTIYAQSYLEELQESEDRNFIKQVSKYLNLKLAQSNETVTLSRDFIKDLISKLNASGENTKNYVKNELIKVLQESS